MAVNPLSLLLASRTLTRKRELAVSCRRCLSDFTSASSSSVKNTGSTARDHLANERTFLAWLRTGLSLIGFGVGLQEYLDHSLETKINSTTSDVHYEHLRRVLPGAALVTSGGVMTCYAGLRYFRVKKHLEMDFFPPAKRGITILTVGASAFSLVALYMVVSPGSLQQKVIALDTEEKPNTTR